MDTPKKMTVAQALAEGYTHFMMKGPGLSPDEFEIFNLTPDHLRQMMDKASQIDEETRGEETYYESRPFLCDKPHIPQLEEAFVASYIEDSFSEEMEMLQNVFERMVKQLPKDKRFKQAVALINEALSEYKSYTATDIELLAAE